MLKRIRKDVCEIAISSECVLNPGKGWEIQDDFEIHLNPLWDKVQWIS